MKKLLNNMSHSFAVKFLMSIHGVKKVIKALPLSGRGKTLSAVIFWLSFSKPKRMNILTFIYLLLYVNISCELYLFGSLVQKKKISLTLQYTNVLKFLYEILYKEQRKHATSLFSSEI